MAPLSRNTISLTLKVLAAFSVLSVFFDRIFIVREQGSEQATISKSRDAKIAKVSMLYGDNNPLYERALGTHEAHNNIHGYPFYVLRQKTLPGFWTKPAYILRLLLSELEKPESERLEWLVWVDVDVTIMNPNIPLEIFLPPSPTWDHIHAVVTNDHRGLNNGVFFLRVHEWSVWVMNSCLNTQISKPDLKLQFEDQSALEHWLSLDEFRNNTIHVPQRWFNAYAGFRGAPNAAFADPWKPTYKYTANGVREGDLLVHHAGHKSMRTQLMFPWVEAAEKHSAIWEMPLSDTNYTAEISDFWNRDAKHEREVVDARQRMIQQALEKKPKTGIKHG